MTNKDHTTPPLLFLYQLEAMPALLRSINATLKVDNEAAYSAFVKEFQHQLDITENPRNASAAGIWNMYCIKIDMQSCI